MDVYASGGCIEKQESREMSLQNLTEEIPGVTMHASQESKCGCVQSIYRVGSQLSILCFHDDPMPMFESSILWMKLALSPQES